MQKVALAIQELNGKLFRKRKLYVNSNRSPKRTLDVTECTQELLVGVWPLCALVCSVLTLQSLADFAFWTFLLLPSQSYCGQSRGWDEIRELL